MRENQFDCIVKAILENQARTGIRVQEVSITYEYFIILIDDEKESKYKGFPVFYILDDEQEENFVLLQ